MKRLRAAARRLSRIAVRAGALAPVLFFLRAAPAFAGVPSAPGDVYQPASYWQWLPMWRWTSAFGIGFNENLGYGDIADAIMRIFATFVFGVAGFVWAFLQFLLVLALQINVTTTAGKYVDKAVSTVGTGITSTTFFTAVSALCIAVAVIALVRKSLGEGLKTFLRTIVCLGAVTAVTVAATQSVATGSSGTIPGSPSWVLSHVNTLTSGLADLTSGLATQAIATEGTQDMPAPNCVTYESELTNLFDAYYARNNAGDTGGASVASSFSALWQQTYLANWTLAQFGNEQSYVGESNDDNAGVRVACRYLEYANNVPYQQQEEVTLLTKPLPPNLYLSAGGPTGPYSMSMTSTVDYLNSAINAWAMCDYNPSTGRWEADPDFSYLTESGTSYASALDSGSCREWWTNGAGLHAQHWGGSEAGGGNPGTDGNASCGLGTCNPFYLPTGGAITNATGGRDPAQTFLTMFNGHGGTTAFMEGIITLVESLFFLFSFGFMILGTIIAQFVLVILLALLPLLLVVFAWPGDLGRRTMVQTGKWFLSASCAKVLLTLAMSILILIVNVLQDVVNGIIPASAGVGASYAQAFVPLIAVFLFHRLLKTVKMHHMIGPRGMLGMATAFVGGTVVGDEFARHIPRRIPRSPFPADSSSSGGPGRRSDKIPSPPSPSDVGQGDPGGGVGPGPYSQGGDDPGGGFGVPGTSSSRRLPRPTGIGGKDPDGENGDFAEERVGDSLFRQDFARVDAGRFDHAYNEAVANGYDGTKEQFVRERELQEYDAYLAGLPAAAEALSFAEWRRGEADARYLKWREGDTRQQYNAIREAERQREYDEYVAGAGSASPLSFDEYFTRKDNEDYQAYVADATARGETPVSASEWLRQRDEDGFKTFREKKIGQANAKRGSAYIAAKKARQDARRAEARRVAAERRAAAAKNREIAKAIALEEQQRQLRSARIRIAARTATRIGVAAGTVAAGPAGIAVVAGALAAKHAARSTRKAAQIVVESRSAETARSTLGAIAEWRRRQLVDPGPAYSGESDSQTRTPKRR